MGDLDAQRVESELQWSVVSKNLEAAYASLNLQGSKKNAAPNYSRVTSQA